MQANCGDEKIGLWPSIWRNLLRCKSSCRLPGEMWCCAGLRPCLRTVLRSLLLDEWSRDLQEELWGHIKVQSRLFGEVNTLFLFIPIGFQSLLMLSRCSHSGPHPRCVQRCLRSCSHGQCQLPCYADCDPCLRICQIDCAHQNLSEGICGLPVPCGPTCENSFNNVRRYALIKQFPHVQDTIERIYSKAGRNMDMFHMEVFKVEKVLRTGFSEFCENITLLNPLDGKQDMRRVWERTEAILPEQLKITCYRDEVIGPIEVSIHKLEVFFNNATIFPPQVLSFKLRHDLLYYFCRCTVIEEAVRLYQHLLGINGSNRQVEIVKIGLRMKAQDQIKRYLEAIKNCIHQSEELNLKRLEVEFRLVQVTFWLILRHDLHLEIGLDVSSSLKRCQVLCGTWPDSAGLFAPILKILQARCESKGRPLPICEWNQSSLRALWRGWGKYGHTGRLEFCRKGHHPYPMVSFRGCPECGREVVHRAAQPRSKSEFQEVQVDDCLQNAQFRAMIRNLRIERESGL